MSTSYKNRPAGITARALRDGAGAALTMAILLVLSASSSADGKITTFDPPRSAGTFPRVINTGGSIAGSHVQGDLTHGFVRAPDGTFTTFDPPGDNMETYPWASTRNA